MDGLWQVEQIFQERGNGMKKDKEWFESVIIKELMTNSGNSDMTTYEQGRVSALKYYLNLIDQLDEPEKVVIPEWFADFIEERLESTSDGDLVMDLWVIYYHGDFPAKHFNWLRNNKELATRAILDGYTIEQTKMLTVIVKDYDKTIMTKQLPEDEVNIYEGGVGMIKRIIKAIQLLFPEYEENHRDEG